MGLVNLVRCRLSRINIEGVWLLRLISFSFKNQFTLVVSNLFYWIMIFLDNYKAKSCGGINKKQSYLKIEIKKKK